MTIQILTLRKNNITDFAKERNNLLEKSKGDWILFLDSDETLSKDLKREIKNLNPNDYSGFYIERENYFIGKYIGTDKILRLGKKGTGKWSRRVHETWNIKGKVGELKNRIIHNSASSLHEMVDKINNYSTLHAEANYVEKKRPDIIKIIFFPKLKFFQSLLMGRGVTFSILQAFHSFLSWSKLYFLHS